LGISWEFFEDLLKMFLPLLPYHQDWVKTKTVLVSTSELRIIRPPVKIITERGHLAGAEERLLSCALYAAEKSGYFNSEIVCKVAVAFAEAGDFNRAQLIINEVEETGYFVFSYPGPRFHLSQQLVFNLENKAKALAMVAGLYAKTERKDKALETLSQALLIAERIESSYDSDEALAEISSKYVELGEDSQALKVIESVKPERFSDGPEELTLYNHRLYLKLANKYLDVGRSGQAFGILERARPKIDAIKDTSPKSKVLAEIGTVYAKAGQSHKADELLSEALEVITTATSQSEPYKSMALTIVAEEYAKSGFCQRAYEVSDTIAVEHNRSDASKRVWPPSARKTVVRRHTLRRNQE
jgi:tetratricopeptide (TPR) repeat protein